MKNKKKKQSKKTPRKFFVIADGDLCVVNSKFFKNLNSRMTALSLGVEIFVELHRHLCYDAVEKEDLYINSISITEGFQRSLVELEKNYPFILDEIRSCERKSVGLIISKC